MKYSDYHQMENEKGWDAIDKKKTGRRIFYFRRGEIVEKGKDDIISDKEAKSGPTEDSKKDESKS